MTRAELALDEQGGYVLQLTIGDKGAYLYAVFGSPIAHEDDAARACEAALRLLEIAEEVPVTDVQVGVATGRLRSGTYGHPERRTFCCLGDAVNLAARLMTRAPVGGVWVHGDVADAAAERFEWEDLPAITVKGREQQVPVRRLLARASRRRSGTDRSSASLNVMVGRDAELARLRDLWVTAESGQGQVVVVQAEAGTGKSRLVGGLVAELVDEGVPVASGEATPLATQASYAAWRGVWTDLLGLDDDSTPDEVTQAVARLDPGLVGRAPLLGPVLGLTLPDSDLTATFDGELSKTSLEDLLGRLLAAVAEEAAGVVLVVEDAHWLDPLSRDLLESLSRTIARAPVLLLVDHPSRRQRPRRPAARAGQPRHRPGARAARAGGVGRPRPRAAPGAGRTSPGARGAGDDRRPGGGQRLLPRAARRLRPGPRRPRRRQRRPRRPRAAAQPAQPGAEPDRRPAGGAAPGRGRGQRDRPGLPLAAGLRGVPRPRARAAGPRRPASPSPRPG